MKRVKSLKVIMEFSGHLKPRSHPADGILGERYGLANAGAQRPQERRLYLLREAAAASRLTCVQPDRPGSDGTLRVAARDLGAAFAVLVGTGYPPGAAG